MRFLCALILSAGISLAAEEAPITRESLEKGPFRSIRAESGRLVFQFKNSGPHFNCAGDSLEEKINDYGETMRVKLGERLKLVTHHMSLEFKPLPPPLDKNGFLIESQFDARSFGGSPSSRYGIALILKGGQGADLRFVEPEKGFDPKLPPTDATYQKIMRTIADADPLGRKDLVAEAAGGVVKPPFPATVTALHFRWQKKAGASDEPLEIRWIAADIGDAAAQDHLILKIVSEPKQASGDFALKQPAAGFPPGEYRIEIWQAGKSIYAQPFEIKE